MRSLASAVALLVVLCLVGCPTPPEDLPPGGDGPGAGPPSGGPPPGAQPPDGAQAPPDAASADEGAISMPPGVPPRFSSIIEDGAPTVTVTVQVTGGSQGTVEFQTQKEVDGHAQVRALHVEEYGSSGKASVTAPATWAVPIYVVAAEHGDDPNRLVRGGLDEPIQLDGKDLSLEVAIGHEPKWLEALTPKPIDPDREPTPPGGTEPSEPE